MKVLKQAFFLIGSVLGALSGAAQAQTTVFQDDFNTWNSSNWGVYDSTNFLQGTQFGNTPKIVTESGVTFARFSLDSYTPDPAYTGSFHRGTEAFVKTPYTIGNGMEFEARLRGKNLPKGIVYAFFTYNSRGVWPETYLKDEIDFELLTNFNNNEMWLNIWDDWNPERFGPQESSRSSLAGLDKNNWNTYKIRWLNDAVEWYVNDVLIRRSTNIVPKDPMQLRFNIWAADNRWTTAYDENLKAAATASANQSYAMDVDWVKVRSLPAGPNPTPTPTVAPTPTPTVKPTPTPTAPTGGVVGNGTGLSGTYYDNSNFTGSTVSRIDPVIDFQWQYASPAPTIDVDTFSARWTGLVQAQFSETYTFTTRTDDGVRLWVNGQKLIDKWINQSPEEYSATITLVTGQKYAIKLEYYENTDGAVAQLFWSSPRTTKQIIPKTQLYPTATVADTTPPTAVITAPTRSGIYSSLLSIKGTAADSGSGVRIVYARLRRLADNKYWDGAAWVAGATLVKVSGTTSWSWSPPALSDGFYTIQMRAEDVALNVFYTTALGFSIDKTLPSGVISAPVNNQTYASLTTIKGTAHDSGSGVRIVYARLRRLSDNTYWSGTAWVTGATLVKVTGTTSWTWTPPPLINSGYTIQMRIEDVAQNVFYTPALKFTIKSAALRSALAQGVTLSDGQAAGDEISLFFTGALGEAAYNVDAWQVSVDDEAVAVKSVSLYDGSVVLQLATKLKSGRKVAVTWRGLRDAQGGEIGGEWKGEAG